MSRETRLEDPAKDISRRRDGTISGASPLSALTVPRIPVAFATKPQVSGYKILGSDPRVPTEPQNRRMRAIPPRLPALPKGVEEKSFQACTGCSGAKFLHACLPWRIGGTRSVRLGPPWRNPLSQALAKSHANPGTDALCRGMPLTGSQSAVSHPAVVGGEYRAAGDAHNPKEERLVIKKLLATTFVGSALSLGVGAATIPQASAQPVVTGGLVNVTVTDVVSHNNVQVQVPVEVAAQLCGVNVNVLAQQNQAVSCTQHTTQDVEQALAAL